MRHINDAGLTLVKSYEKFKPNVYDDGYGYLTIGYGHKLLPNETFKTVTEPEAITLLEKDLAKAEYAVSKLCKAALQENQYAALVSFTFNEGAGTFERSTLRQKINRGDYEAAPKEFRKYVYASHKKSTGLARRREAEISLWNSGVVPMGPVTPIPPIPTPGDQPSTWVSQLIGWLQNLLSRGNTP